MVAVSSLYFGRITETCRSMRSRSGPGNPSVRNGPVSSSIRAGTFPLRISKVSAGTWIHRRYQDKIRRIGEGCIHTGNMYFSVFQRLAQDFQHCSWKFRQLVQEKYAAVSQGHFPRSGDTATADEPRHGDRMMRTSKRAFPHDIFRFIEPAML